MKTQYSTSCGDSAVGNSCGARAEFFDIVVYGGTSAGVIAAVQAARMGRSVVVIEPGHHLGGLTSGGLGMTDSGNKAVIGGLTREFYQRIKKHYDDDTSWRQQTKADYSFYDSTADALFRFEPSVAEKVFNEMAQEAGVQIVLGERLERAQGVVKRGDRLVSIALESGRTFEAPMFIDASYEGDLLASAGVAYHVGRESTAQYGETLNGVQTEHAIKHQFVKRVDPYVKLGEPGSGLLPGIRREGPGREGGGDDLVQAYNFRMCLTDDPSNRVAFSKPADYEPKRYELLARYVAQMPEWNDIFGNHQMMPNRKTDTNNHGAFGTDFIGMNHEYPEGDYATRERIIHEHESYQQGLMWFLANDPRLPLALRERVACWGLAKDEFLDNGHWPHQIYVREARRMISDYVQTEHDCRCTRDTPEPVGMGSYQMDSHNCQRYVDDNGFVRNEGDIQVGLKKPYQISYRSIRPKAESCKNLLVPVCISSSHIAYGSVRMEPVFMVLGQSAATAACLALEDGVSVQEVPYAKLAARLVADRQVLDYETAVEN